MNGLEKLPVGTGRGLSWRQSMVAFTLILASCINGVLSYSYHPFRVTAKVLNLLDADYFHPGVEQADSGNTFDERSLGFRNSLIPQPGRSYVLAFSIDY